MSAVEIVAKTLATHERVVCSRGYGYRWSCECGTVLHVHERVDAAHREHQGHAVIVALGKKHAVVALPEPHMRFKDEVTTRWEEAMPHTVDVWDDNPDQVQLSYNFEPAEPLTADEAAYLGAALIAASRLARADVVPS